MAVLFHNYLAIEPLEKMEGYAFVRVDGVVSKEFNALWLRLWRFCCRHN
jgi:hypothetical protein